MVLFSLVANRLLQQAGPSIFKRRIGRWPCAFLTAGSLSYALNVAVFRQIQQNDYKELGLDKYYSLDLNADMMQKDLEERFNIRVKAQHFDLQQAQARVDLEEQERLARTQQQEARIEELDASIKKDQKQRENNTKL